MAGQGEEKSGDSTTILDPSSSFHPVLGRTNPSDLIRAVLADKSAFSLLKSAIKADSQTQVDQGPPHSENTDGAIKAQTSADPEVSII